MRWTNQPIVLALFLTVTGVFDLAAQAVTDLSFRPNVGVAAFEEGRGPVVLVDEGHHNYRTIRPTQIPHSEVTMPGRYEPLGRLLRRDGYAVIPLDGAFTPQALAEVDVLVIAGALAESTVDDFSLPNPPAFTPDEIEVVDSWVRQGGSLLLVAGTQPAPAAAAALAERFGLLFGNGIAIPVEDEVDWTQSDWMRFRREEGSLRDHPIARGRDEAEAIDSIMTFGGQAFRAKPGADVQPLLVFTEPVVLIFELDPFDPLEYAPRIRADGMFQAATIRHGAGRVAVFGEEGMFAAQVTRQDRRPIGMNHPGAGQNAQFALNVIHWLSGLITE